MKRKRILSIILALALCAAVIVPAAAAAGDSVLFSLVNVVVNGEAVGNAGEFYALANGESAPVSISYVDAQGGTTTYLPVRKISEVLGVDIGWDGETQTVYIGGQPAAEQHGWVLTSTAQKYDGREAPYEFNHGLITVDANSSTNSIHWRFEVNEPGWQKQYPSHPSGSCYGEYTDEVITYSGVQRSYQGGETISLTYNISVEHSGHLPERPAAVFAGLSSGLNLYTSGSERENWVYASEVPDGGWTYTPAGDTAPTKGYGDRIATVSAQMPNGRDGDTIDLTIGCDTLRIVYTYTYYD